MGLYPYPIYLREQILYVIFFVIKTFLDQMSVYMRLFKKNFTSECKWPAPNKNVTDSKIGHISSRRKRDSNPRAGCPTYTLSRGASSAS